MDGNGSAAVSGGELSPEEFQSVVTRWMRGVSDGGYNPADALSSATTLADMTDFTVGRSLMSAPNSATRNLFFSLSLIRSILCHVLVYRFACRASKGAQTSLLVFERDFATLLGRFSTIDARAG